jgi:hypothetical protein
MTSATRVCARCHSAEGPLSPLFAVDGLGTVACEECLREDPELHKLATSNLSRQLLVEAGRPWMPASLPLDPVNGPGGKLEQSPPLVLKEPPRDSPT